MKIDRQIENKKAIIKEYADLLNEIEKEEKYLSDIDELELSDKLAIKGIWTKIQCHEQALKIILLSIIESRENELRKMEAHRLKVAIPEFEKLSAECNMNLPAVIKKAEKHIGKEPKAVTDEINLLLNQYSIENDNLNQEARNDIYSALIRHLNFLSQTYKQNQ